MLILKMCCVILLENFCFQLLLNMDRQGFLKIVTIVCDVFNQKLTFVPLVFCLWAVLRLSQIRKINSRSRLATIFVTLYCVPH